MKTAGNTTKATAALDTSATGRPPQGPQAADAAQPTGAPAAASDGTPASDGTATSAETRAERRRARIRASIADTALTLFMSRGYDATTVEDVAAAVDMSPRTVFRYFPFKEDMLRGAVHVGLEELLAALRDRPEAEPPAVALGRALMDVWTQDGRDPEEIRALLRLIADLPRVRGLLLEATRTNQQGLADVLAPRLNLPPDDLVTRVAAAAALAALNLVLEIWAELPAGTDLAPLLDTVAAELAAGPLRPRRQHPPRGRRPRK